jgi:hypothetical protein
MHGQLGFTKLNIIDKFGQAISAIDPKPAKRSTDGFPDTIYPCLGDQVSPGLIPHSNHLNTVTALTDPDPQLLLTHTSVWRSLFKSFRRQVSSSLAGLVANTFESDSVE